jgi:hypothetical protein
MRCIAPECIVKKHDRKRGQKSQQVDLIRAGLVHLSILVFVVEADGSI